MSKMTMTLHTLSFPNPPILIANKASSQPSSLYPVAGQFRRRAVLFRSSPTQLLLVNPLPARHFCRRRPELLYGRNVRVYAGEVNVDRVDNADGNGARDYRGESTMPERFRHLTKEVPEPPLRWPWFIAAGFLLYAWRAVLYELLNWKKTTIALFELVAYLAKLVFALILQVIGRPVTSLIYFVETAMYTARAFYSAILAYAPVGELTAIIILSSAILAISEAAAPDSVVTQSYALTIASLAAYATLANKVTLLFFCTVLVALYSFSRLIRKRDPVTSALPVAAILTAVSGKWVQTFVIVSFVALAISHHSNKSPEEKEEAQVVVSERKVPLPLLLVGLAVGINVAAKWAGYRHLTWMIV